MKRQSYSIIFFASIITATPKIIAQTHNSVPQLRAFDLISDFSWTIPKKEDSPKKSVCSGTAGVRMKFLHMETRIFADRDQIDTTHFLNNFCCQDPRWGISLFFLTKSTPITLSAGMIHYSGALSRLKNPPAAATANPLRLFFPDSTGLHTTLPSRTSPVQPYSVTLSLTAPVKKKASKITVQGTMFSDKTILGSASRTISLSSRSSLKATVTAGRFYLENNSAALRNQGGSYDCGFFSAGLIQFNILTPHFKSMAECAVHQSPWGPAAVWYMISNRIIYGRFLLDSLVFNIPTAPQSRAAAALISADGTPCRTFGQIGLNPQISAGAFRFGIYTLGTLRISSEKNPSDIAIAKIRTAVSYEKSFLTVRVDGGAVNIPVKGKTRTRSAIPEKYYSAIITTVTTFSSIKVRCSFSSKFYEGAASAQKQKQAYSTAANFSMGMKKNISASLNSTFYFRNGTKTGGNLTTALAFRVMIKGISTFFKCSVQTTF